MKSAIKFGALLFMAFAACTPKTEPDPDPDSGSGTTSVGQSIIIPQEAGTEVTVEIEAAGSWQIVNNTDWLSISPLSGFSGEATLKMYSRESNMDIYEKSGTFTLVVNGTEEVTFHVFQDGVKGMVVGATEAGVNGSAGQAYVYVETNTEFTATFDQSWASVSGIEYDLSETLLEDGKTPSRVQTARVVLDVEANPTTDLRSGTLALDCNGTLYNVAVNQGLTSNATITDFETPFFRRSLAMRFTATWCGYCPMMAESFKEAINELPDRIVGFTVYADDGSSLISSDCANELSNMYRVNGYPTGKVNALATVQNYDPSIGKEIIIGLAEEAVEQLPAKTAISAATVTENGIFKLLASIASKESMTYTLHVYLLEDGVIEEQESYDAAYPGGDDYVHNYVERCAVTGSEGVKLQGFVNSTANYALEYDIPDDVFDNIDNVYAVIYVTYDYDGTFQGSVPNALYSRSGHIVDNVVKIPLNGQTDFEYEN